MTVEKFHEKLSALMAEAAQSKMPISMVVATLEMLKVEIITDQIAFTKRQSFIAAQAASKNAQVAPLIVPAN